MISLRPIEAGDCPRVVRLHRAAFPPGEIACTIFGAPGVARYLASLLAFPRYQPEHALWGAWDGERLAGYAHFRELPEAWHLNQIAVHPAYRGCGVGRLLWERFAAEGACRGCSRLSLDVESGNLPVIAWYRRRGLREAGCTWRYERETLPGAAREPEAGSLRLLGWEQAEAWQQRYGFSSFQVLHQGRAWPIGRLGRVYFRAGEALPTAVEAALAEIDPGRRLLLFAAEPLNLPGFRPRGSSLRMLGEL